MKFRTLLLAALVSVAGCDRSRGPPPPLAIEQVPSVLQKAFTKAKPEAKDLVDQIVGALAAKDFSKAYLGFQALLAQSGLNKDQQSVASRGMLSVNGMLQEAQSKGDTHAADTLKAYRFNK
jgi:hypothetical protein